ncbi:MAG: MerR family transcriptional regulator [Gammaproteobacteria bacterium]|nr:MerR family transcriptional regulator [Gammaproteobacteria bacterium]
MKIGKLAERTGVSVRTLRYYEAQGLLTPHRRASGYRDYTDEDERIVKRIRALSAAGLKLEIIAELLPCVRSDAIDFEPCEQLRMLLHEETEALAKRIETLKASHALLSAHLDAAK